MEEGGREGVWEGGSVVGREEDMWEGVWCGEEGRREEGGGKEGGGEEVRREEGRREGGEEEVRRGGGGEGEEGRR